MAQECIKKSSQSRFAVPVADQVRGISKFVEKMADKIGYKNLANALKRFNKAVSNCLKAKELYDTGSECYEFSEQMEKLEAGDIKFERGDADVENQGLKGIGSACFKCMMHIMGSGPAEIASNQDESFASMFCNDYLEEHSPKK